jgi:hypothetical protein
MPRIHPAQPDQTDAKTAATLKAVNAKLGMLANLFTTLAQAPVALTGYLQLSESLGQGRLTPPGTAVDFPVVQLSPAA